MDQPVIEFLLCNPTLDSNFSLTSIILFLLQPVRILLIIYVESTRLLFKHEPFGLDRFATDHSITKAASRPLFVRVRRCAPQTTTPARPCLFVINEWRKIGRGEILSRRNMVAGENSRGK